MKIMRFSGFAISLLRNSKRGEWLIEIDSVLATVKFMIAFSYD